jgi:hypothetical protein
LSTTGRTPLPVHRLHDDEVERLLASGERRAELKALFGDTGYRELSALARRAAATRTRRAERVYVLPGLMGSRIGTRGMLLDDVLWVDLVEIAAGHLTRLALPRGARLRALGAMLLNTLKLKLSLRIAGFDARLHPYDWRMSVGDLAAELGRRIDDEGSRKVMLVGHSMGGVVARAALAASGQERITRVVQLGAPNAGSFAPVLALRGVYPTVRKLAAIDQRHDAEDLARIVFRTLPALHELLPDSRIAPAPNLFDAGSWPDDALRPDPQLLAAAAAARALWPAADARCLHVIGIRQETVTRAIRNGDEFDYEVTLDGDGTVPLSLALLPGQAAWYVAEKHGGLPNNGRVIAATVDLLRTGTTARLPATARRARQPTSRTVSEVALRRIAPHKVHWQALSLDARRRLLEPVVSPEFHGAVSADEIAVRAGQASPPGTPRAHRRVIELRLARGSIVEANARALVLGVFRNVDPAGAAAAVDRSLGGAIREFTLRRMFSGHLGQVFVMPAARSPLLAELVLFAGLGDFDDFGTEAQSFVAENIVRTFARTRVEDFATVLLGAGSGVPVALAVEHQLQGFLAGLRHADPEQVVRRITLCEIDPRKYDALRRAMQRLAPRLAGDDFELVVDETALPSAGAVATPRRQRRSRARPAPPDPAYLLVSLREHSRTEFESRCSLLTAGAKAAVLSGTLVFAKKDLLRLLEPIESGTIGARDMARFGTGLARLLLASNVRGGLETVTHRPLVVVHDREASRVPWEAMRIGAVHPALERGASRRYEAETLTVARWREDRLPGDRLNVLLVANPTGDLPGAATEASALRRLLGARHTALDVLEGRDATRARILGALASGDYDVLHFAGHGFFDTAEPGRSGLICAGEEVLRGADLDGLGNLPAVVFFNACEAARVRRASRRARTHRLFGPLRSSSIAEAFLDGGVANFLGTHWPVGDEAALLFSTRLYEALLDGARLGDAVLAARLRVFQSGSIDWADYVHYGNPAFLLGDFGPPQSR